MPPILNTHQTTSFLDSALHLLHPAPSSTIEMSLIRTSIETDGNYLSADSSEFSDNCDEKGAPVPDDPDEWRRWGKDVLGDAWHADVEARKAAAQNAREQEEERERIDKAKVDGILKLRDTNPMEYYRQMKEYNIGLQTAAQADDMSNPVEAVVRGNWFLDKQTNARAERMELSQQPPRERTVKRTSKQPASTLAKALERERKVPTTKRRRNARELVQPSIRRSARKQNSTVPIKKQTVWAQRLRSWKQTRG
jgi:hypothetical protein